MAKFKDVTSTYIALREVEAACDRAIGCAQRLPASDHVQHVLDSAVFIRRSLPASAIALWKHRDGGLGRIWSRAKFEVEKSANFGEFCNAFFDSDCAEVAFRQTQLSPLLFGAATIRAFVEAPPALPAPESFAMLSKALDEVSGSRAAEMLLRASPVEELLRLKGGQVYRSMDLQSRHIYHLAVDSYAARNRIGKLEAASRLAGFGEADIHHAIHAERITEQFGRPRPGDVGVNWMRRLALWLLLSIAYFVVCGFDGWLRWILVAFAMPIIIESTLALSEDLESQFVGAFLPCRIDLVSTGVKVPVWVAIPLLIHDERQLEEVAERLLWNIRSVNDSNVRFILLTDLPDSQSEPSSGDDESAVAALERCLGHVNTQLGKRFAQPAFFAHRKRTYNAREGRWMGSGRKLGKITALNRALVLGEWSFSYASEGLREALMVRSDRVFVCDEDTLIGRNCIQLLAGALDHPANRERAVLGKAYGRRGIAVPAIHTALDSVSNWRFASMIAGRACDPKVAPPITASARFDLYLECLFPGKGLYEPNVFLDCLPGEVDQVALSHDTVESLALRPMYVGDAAVFDEHPKTPISLAARNERWARGDFINFGHTVFGDQAVRGIIESNALGRYTILCQVASWLALAACLPVAAVSLLIAREPISIVGGLSIVLFPNAIRALRATVRQTWDEGRLARTIGFPRNLSIAMGAAALKVWAAPRSFAYVSRALLRAGIACTLRRSYLDWSTSYQAETTLRSSRLRTLGALSAAVAGSVLYVEHLIGPVGLVVLLSWALLPHDSKFLIRKAR